MKYLTKPRILLSTIIIILGLIIAAVPQNTTLPYKLTVGQILDEIKNGTQFIHPDQVAQMIIEKNPSLQLIDIRSQDDYEKFHLPGAINIPIDDILSEDYLDILDQDVKMNVFYSNGNTKSNEAWMLTRQLGYNNIYVLMGGLNYWVETIMNPKVPSSTLPDDEIAKYDFRKGAGSALGGGAVPNENAASTPAAPAPIIKKAKKKAVKGGC